MWTWTLYILDKAWGSSDVNKPYFLHGEAEAEISGAFLGSLSKRMNGRRESSFPDNQFYACFHGNRLCPVFNPWPNIAKAPDVFWNRALDRPSPKVQTTGRQARAQGPDPVSTRFWEGRAIVCAFFAFVLCVAAFVRWREKGAPATENFCPTKSKILTIWAFTGKAWV